MECCHYLLRQDINYHIVDHRIDEFCPNGDVIIIVKICARQIFFALFRSIWNRQTADVNQECLKRETNVSIWTAFKCNGRDASNGPTA